MTSIAQLKHCQIGVKFCFEKHSDRVNGTLNNTVNERFSDKVNETFNNTVNERLSNKVNNTVKRLFAPKNTVVPYFCPSFSSFFVTWHTFTHTTV